jgi:hypothetical protein
VGYLELESATLLEGWRYVLIDMLCVGKVGMSVLVKGLAMDFEREGRNEMAVTSIWPASVCIFTC